MNSSQLIPLIINLLIAIIIGHYIGKKRHIGFWWSLLVCLGTTSFIGIIITLISPRLDSPPHEPTRFKKNTGIILIVISVLFLIVYLEHLITNRPLGNINPISPSISLLILGLYLYHLSKQGNILNR
jgi:predicted membrane channel-forming protein YqfA (hemolysin III family)